MLDLVRGVHEQDQEGEGERLDTLVRAEHRWIHLVHVGVAHGDGITMPWVSSEMGEGQR